MDVEGSLRPDEPKKEHSAVLVGELLGLGSLTRIRKKKKGLKKGAILKGKITEG